MDNTKKSPSVLSFCTGYGGIEIGLERAIGEINILAYVEIEAYAVANLVAKMETGAMVPTPVWTDLKTFPAQCFSGSVDILTGGYPCQPFSTAGKRKGKDDPKHLWPWIREHIRIIRPKICFFENVEGHISLGLREVLTDLVGLGYRVESDIGEPTWGLFSAAECGAPHQRKRVFILANSRSAKLNRVSEPEEWREDRAIGVTGFGMADTRSQGLQESGWLRKVNKLKAAERGCYNEQWPARPGEPQHEWEEPRVLDDSAKQRFQIRASRQMGEQREKQGLERSAESNKRQTQPSVGGIVDECSIGVDTITTKLDGMNRIDRLRLLGNGVVPATAEKAFLTLMNRITNPHSERRHVEVQMELFA